MDYRDTEKELELIAWQWAGVEMLRCEKMPGCWEAWLKFAESLPSGLTDSKVAGEFAKFVDGYRP